MLGISRIFVIPNACFANQRGLSFPLGTQYETTQSETVLAENGGTLIRGFFVFGGGRLIVFGGGARIRAPLRSPHVLTQMDHRPVS